MQSSSGSYQNKQGNPGPVQMAVERILEKSTVSGTTTAKVTASATESQVFEVPPENDGGGSKITFPPGSLSIDTDITVAEAAPVASNVAAAELDMGVQITPAGQSLSIQPAVSADPIQPFTVSLALPSAALSQSLDTVQLLSDNLVVVYRIQSFAENKTYVGVVPTPEITVVDRRVSFKTRFFGAFQLAYTSQPIIQPVRVVSNVLVKTKREVTDLPAITVTGRKPVVVGQGTTVEITGRHFRPTMVVAMGGKIVPGLNVQSDSLASFSAPVGAAFGLTSVDLIQDGVSQTMSVFYRGDKNDFPIITDDPQNICEGLKFYDQSGTLKEGSKSCKVYNICSKDGEEGCVTTGKFKAADMTILTPSHIRKNITIAGVLGSYPSSTSPLDGADSTTDLTASQFSSLLQSAQGFEYFGSDGTRYTGSGSSQLVATNIKQGVTIFGVSGGVAETPGTCTADGQTSCVAVASFPAAAASGLASKVLSGQSVAGVAGNVTLPAAAYVRVTNGNYGVGGNGTVPTLADCVVNNATGCVTTASYRSADWTQLVPTNIKSGATIAGVAGTYPSVGNLLTGADSTADLDTATLDAKLKSPSSFEWFGPDGSRYTGAGDPDILVSNIVSGVTVFGTTGTVPIQCTSTNQGVCTSDPTCRWNSGSCEVNPWNIRTSATIAGTSGLLKTNCRNSITNSKYNFDGAVGSLTNSGTTAGTTADYWDTVDDYYGSSSLYPGSWSGNTLCGSSNWTDITSLDGGNTNVSCGTSSVCIYRDELSGLRVSGKTATPSTYAWNAAVQACAILAYGGYGAGSWRLPTQKELMTLYQNGILSVVSASFFTLVDFQGNFWSSSTYSNIGTNAWFMQVAAGYTQYQTKATTSKVLCVQ